MEHFGDNLSNFLKKAATKIEELQLQTALGKAELSDKLEEIKKESLEQYHEFKHDINSAIDKGDQKWDELKAKLEHLELQLALGKAETKEVIEEQKKNLNKAIADVKHFFNKN